jgi:hypothetical protein
MRVPRLRLVFIGLAAVSFVLSYISLRASAASAGTDSGSLQPYIDSLKAKHGIPDRPPAAPPTPSSSEAAAQWETSRQVTKDPRQMQPYLETLREKHGLGPSESTEANLAPPKPSSSPQEVQPYIESVKSGYELRPKYDKLVHNAAGLTVAASNHFDITSEKNSANNFDQVYQTDGKFIPSLDLFYEHQFFRDRYAGALGAVGHIGFIMLTGRGVFTNVTGKPQSQDTNFKFMAYPVSIGASYRLVQTRFVVPFIQVSAVGIPYIESRDDDKPSRRGISRGLSINGGASFNLDWISRKDAWNLYDFNGILHTSLLFQLEHLQTLSGAVSFNYTGLMAGLMFEF